MQPTAPHGSVPSAAAHPGHPAGQHPGQHPGQQASSEVSISPAQGWHVSHLFYRFDRARLAALGADGAGGRYAALL